MTKIRLKRGEKSDIYLTHVCRQLQSLESPEKTYKVHEISAKLRLSSAVKYVPPPPLPFFPLAAPASIMVSLLLQLMNATVLAESSCSF